MIRTLVVVPITVLVFCSLIFGQGSKKPTNKPIVKTIVLPDSDELEMPEIKDFALIVRIAASGTTLAVQKREDEARMDISDVGKFVSGLAQQPGQRSASARSLDPVLIIRPESSSSYDSILEVIKALRTTRSRIKVDCGGGTFVVVPRKLSDRELDRPNPLLLVVTFDQAGKIDLNGEDAGSLDDVAPLLARLKDIVKSREVNGVFRSGTNEVERTVFVSAPPQSRFADVLKLIAILRDCGASPIGLQIEQPVFRVEMIVPVKP